MEKYLLISVQLYNEFVEVCIVENDYFAQVYHIDSNYDLISPSISIYDKLTNFYSC